MNEPAAEAQPPSIASVNLVYDEQAPGGAPICGTERLVVSYVTPLQPGQTWGLRLFRNGRLARQTSATAYNQTTSTLVGSAVRGLISNFEYTFGVQAFDASGDGPLVEIEAARPTCDGEAVPPGMGDIVMPFYFVRFEDQPGGDPFTPQQFEQSNLRAAMKDGSPMTLTEMANEIFDDKVQFRYELFDWIVLEGSLSDYCTPGQPTTLANCNESAIWPHVRAALPPGTSTSWNMENFVVMGLGLGNASAVNIGSYSVLWAGLGDPGILLGSGTTVLHELVHHLDQAHVGVLSGDDVIDDIAWSNEGGPSLMGFGYRTYAGVSAAQRMDMGVLGSTEVTHVGPDATRNILLSLLDSTRPGPKLAIFESAALPEGMYGFIEYSGNDELPRAHATSPRVRIGVAQAVERTDAPTIHQLKVAYFEDRTLNKPGQSAVVASMNLQVELVSFGSGALSAFVRVGPITSVTCAAKPIEISRPLFSNWFAAHLGSTQAYMIEVTNNDAVGCPDRTVELRISDYERIGTLRSYDSEQVTLAPGASATRTLELTHPDLGQFALLYTALEDGKVSAEEGYNFYVNEPLEVDVSFHGAGSGQPPTSVEVRVTNNAEAATIGLQVGISSSPNPAWLYDYVSGSTESLPADPFETVSYVHDFSEEELDPFMYLHVRVQHGGSFGSAEHFTNIITRIVPREIVEDFASGLGAWSVDDGPEGGEWSSVDENARHSFVPETEDVGYGAIVRVIDVPNEPGLELYWEWAYGLSDDLNPSLYSSADLQIIVTPLPGCASSSDADAWLVASEGVLSHRGAGTLDMTPYAGCSLELSFWAFYQAATEHAEGWFVVDNIELVPTP